MKTRFTYLLTFVFALLAPLVFAQAQTIQISGTVSDEEGVPIPGVNITVQGESTGTSTDFDGNYSISTEQGKTLVFTSIGFQDQSVAVGSDTTINVSMVQGTALDEIIVVGYGKTTKQAFTGSAVSIKSEAISSKNLANAADALAGEISGVSVLTSTGQPGSEPKIRIRGFGSVNGNRDPLIVVDGVPFAGSLSQINPDDIADLTVLKDATATAIYGSRGANGVVLVETKKGKSGVSQITTSFKMGQNFQLLPRHKVLTSPEQYMELSWEGLKNRGEINGESDPIDYANNTLFDGAVGLNPHYNMWDVASGADFIDPSTGKVRSGVNRLYTPERWKDEAFKASVRTEADVNFSGGHDKTTYYASFGYLNDKGYSINSDYNRYTARLNVDQQITDWLDGSLNLGYMHSKSNNNGQATDSGSVFWFVDNTPPIYPVFERDENGNKIEDPIYGGFLYDYGEARSFGTGTNAIADATYGLDRNKQNSIDLSNAFTAQIVDGLTFETRFGLQYRHEQRDIMNSPFYGPSASSGGSISKRHTTYYSYNFSQLLRYSKSYGDHNIEAFGAHEIYNWKREYMSAFMSNLVIPDIPELNNGVVSSPPSSFTRDYAIESYFGQLNYNYDDRYFLSGSIRRDGSSRFAKGNKWGTFGSVGASWVITNEDFMSNVSWLDQLKLKASYGLIGDQTIGREDRTAGYYPSEDLFDASNLNDEISLSFNSKGNPDLTWETSKMFQTGVEFNIGGFLDGSVDYYIKNTDDLIFDRRVPVSLGYATITVNDGKMRNSGVEFDFTAHIIKNKDFYLDVNLNGATLNNKMKTMPIDPSNNKEKTVDVAGNFGRAKGHSLFDYYIRESAGVDSETGAALWNKYVDKSTGEAVQSMANYLADNPDAEFDIETTEDYSEATRKFVGKSAIPKLNGGFGVQAGYANFDLSMQFRYSIGGHALDGLYQTLMGNGQVGDNNWHSDIANRWQKPGDITDVPRLSANADQNVNGTSTRFLTSMSYLQLNNVRLGYTFPSDIVKSLGISRLNLSVTATNLALFSKRRGFNPTMDITGLAEGGTSAMYFYQPLSSVTGGISVTF